MLKINFLLTISIDYHEQSLWELTKWSQREKYLIFYQILSTNSSRKCMEISLENLYVYIATLRVKKKCYWFHAREGNILKEMCTNETLTLMCTTIFPSVCSWDLIGDNDENLIFYIIISFFFGSFVSLQCIHTLNKSLLVNGGLVAVSILCYTNGMDGI